MLERFLKVQELIEAREPFVIVRLVHARGHSPQSAGACALVGTEGLIEGTVGGGSLEARAISHARALLEDPSDRAPRHDFVTWNLQRDLGMSCGGEVSLYFEVLFRHDWHVVVFGAGHVAQRLIPLLLTLDCRVSCVDSRADWLERLPRSPKLAVKQVAGENPQAAMAAETRAIPSGAFVLVMTQGHGHDLPVLKALLEAGEPPFVGAIGSDLKGKALRDELAEAGIARERCERVHCPLGLPLGSNEPAEIAVSIAAQLLQARDRLRGSRWE